MELYEGKIINNLEIIEIDSIETKRQQRKVWKCYCHKCDQTKSIQGRCINENTEDCGCGRRIRAEATKRKRLLDSANQYIGTINDKGTEILGLDEEQTKIKNTIMLSCRCGVCKREYSAPLNQIRVGKYKTCIYCSKTNNNFSVYKRGDTKC
jgi:hypothetical protein